MSTAMRSTAEVAERLGIHPSRVRRLATKYGIGTRVGARVWVFTDTDIDRLREHSTGSSGRPRKEAT